MISFITTPVGIKPKSEPNPNFLNDESKASDECKDELDEGMLVEYGIKFGDINGS